MTPSNHDSDRSSAGSMPDNAGNGLTKEKLKEDARDAKREVGARAREQVESGQHRLADEADNLSDAIDAAASSLDDHDREGLARYARELSSNLAAAAGQLEDRSVDELANDAKHLARNNPALFMLGSIAVGFGLSRFFKATSERDHDENSAYRSGDAFGEDKDFSDLPVQGRERDMAAANPQAGSPGRGNGRDML